MRRLILLFAFVGLLFAESLNAGQIMSLEQCLRTGIENNPSLRASQFKAESADQDIKAARADFLPSLNTSYTAARIDSISATGQTTTDYLSQDIRAFNIKMTQILYAGSRIVNSYEKAQFLEQAARAEMDMAKLELIYNIETTFYKVMKAKQDVITAAESVNRLAESVKVAEAFFRKELVPQVDVLRARVDLADAENQLSLAKNNENRQRVALFSLMDLPSDPNVDFYDAEHHDLQELPSFESCFQSATEKRPDLKSLEYQFKAADKQTAIALGKYLPVVRFDVGYYDQSNAYDNREKTNTGFYTRDQENTYWQTGITLSWDLFDGGRAWYESEKYTLEGRKINAVLKNAQNTIATGIRKALYSLAEAEQRRASSSGALKEARENFTAEKNRLKAGVSTITALLDAQIRLVRAQSNAANATLDYQLAQSELKFMTGS